jgi:EF-P beta-lysylation protein EpmB
MSMRTAIRDAGELCRRLGLPEDIARGAQRSTAGFPVFVPSEFFRRIRPGNPDDPLLRQVLPVADETNVADGFGTDPVGDERATLRPGLVKKYFGRALLVVTGACAVHCRYCFRRHYPYGEAPKSMTDWQSALDTIAADESVHEVLFSGGDPLTVVDPRLSELAHSVAGIAHVRRLRVHTRLPIMIPSRVNDDLLGWLLGTRLQPYVVVHANHPQEIDEHVVAAFRRLVDAGIPVLNQTVLLRGVNDRAEVLADLCERLIDVGVLPYYLHQLDRVQGAAHFEVPVDEGRQIVARLRARLPGYGVPQYVCEVTGEPGKTPIT